MLPNPSIHVCDYRGVRYRYTGVNDVSHNPKQLHFNDVAHLIHVAVDTALHDKGMDNMRKVIIEIGALFKHANN